MSRKIIPLLLFLFLLVSITEATRLDLGETTTIAGKIATLVNIGEFGSAILAIEGQSEPLIIKQYGTPTFIDKFEIKIRRWEIEPDGSGFIEYELIQKEIKCNIDSDCDDNNICTFDSCNKRTGTCLNLGDNCESNGQCFPEGAILNDSKKYCKDNNWFNQKTSKEDCSNNYECLSNFCLNNKCTGYLIGEETEGFLSKITGYSIKKEGGNKKMNWLIFLFGMIILVEGILFVIAPKKFKEFLSSFSHYSNKFFKIFGIILIIIGFVLILVYLT